MAVLRHPSHHLTLADGLAVALLLLAAGISAFVPFFGSYRTSGEASSVCVVSHDGISEAFPLSVDRTLSFSSNGCALTVSIRNGTAAVTASDCPDQVCVNSGSISRAGQAIVCVPARVVVRIEGTSSGDIDAVAGGGP
ncbi:MAG: NusG domain II-containing protein [Eubacteriales bacterium]